MAERNLVLQLLITAKDQASSIITGLKAQLAVLATAIAAAFSTRGAMDFEVALSKLAARADETGPALKELLNEAREAAQTLGPKFGVSATEAAGGLTSLVAAGFSAKESIAALPGVLALAAMEGIGLERAATLISDAISQFGLKASDATKVANVLAAAAGAVAATATDMGEALKYTGTAASQAGLSITETAAVLDVLGKAGQRGSEAGTGLASVLSILANPTHAATKALFELGATSTQLGDVLELIQSRGLKATDVIGLFGEQGGRIINTLIAQGGTGAIKKFADEIEHSGRTAEQAAQIMKDNLSGALDRFWESIKRVGVELASPSLPGYTSALDGLTAALNRVVSNQAIHAFSERLQAGFARVGAVLADVGQAVSEVFGRVDWGSIGQSASAAFDGIQSAAKRAVSAFQSLITPLTDGFPDAARVAELATSALNSVMEALSGTAGVIASAMERLATAFGRATGTTQEVGTASAQAATQIATLRQEQEAVARATDAQESGYRKLLNALREFSTQTVPRVFGDMADGIGAAARAAYDLGNRLADFASGLITGVRPGVEALANTFGRLFEGFSSLVGVFTTGGQTVISVGKLIGSSLGVVFSALAGTISGLSFAVMKMTETVLVGWLELKKLAGTITDADAAKLSARIERVGAAAEALKNVALNSFHSMETSMDGVGEALSGMQAGAGSAGSAVEELGKKADSAGASLNQANARVADLTKALDEQQAVVDRLAEANAHGAASNQEYGDAVQKLWETQEQLKKAQEQAVSATKQAADATRALAQEQRAGTDETKNYRSATDDAGKSVTSAADEMNRAIIITAALAERQQAMAMAQTQSADAARSLSVEVQKGTIDATKNSIAWTTAATAQNSGAEAAGKLGTGLYAIKNGGDVATEAAERHAAAVKLMSDSVKAGVTIQATATQATDGNAAAMANLRATYIATKLAYDASEAALARGEITQQEATKTRNAARDALNSYNQALEQNVEGTKKTAEATDAAAKSAIDAAKADIDLSRSKGDLITAGQQTVTLAQLEAEWAVKQAAAKLAQIQAERAEIQAKLDQKQAIENKLPADNAEIAALQLKLVATGKAAEAAQLESAIKQQQALNAQSGTQLTQQNTQATQQNTEATEKNANASREGGEVLKSLISVYVGVREGMSKLSEAAARYYDVQYALRQELFQLSSASSSVQAIQNVSNAMAALAAMSDKAGAEMAGFRKELADAQATIRQGEGAYARATNSFAMSAANMAIAAGKTREEFYKQKIEITLLREQIDEMGTAGLRSGGNVRGALEKLQEETKNAATSFNLLAQQDLDRLGKSIDDATKRLEEFKKEAGDAQQRLAQLDEELAREQGDTRRADLLRQQIEYQQQLAEIQHHLQQAEAAHNNELIRLYQEQISRLNELNDLRIRNIEAENKKPTTKPETKPESKPPPKPAEPEPNPNPPPKPKSEPKPEPASPVFTLNLVMGSKSLTATTTTNPTEFLSALERSKSLSVSP